MNNNLYGIPKIQTTADVPTSLNATITDSKGRQLKIRPLDVLYESRLMRMLGAESASNPTYMFGFVYPTVSVYEIDGVAINPPTTQQELDDAIEGLGREGLTAIGLHLQALTRATP